jgi:hypothetical protein
MAVPTEKDKLIAQALVKESDRGCVILSAALLSEELEESVSLTTGMGDGALLWQVACEFVAASRKLAPFGFTQAEAWRELEGLRRLWKTILPSEKCTDAR